MDHLTLGKRLVASLKLLIGDLSAPGTSTELLATLDAGELGNACILIGTFADHYDTELEKEFGGEKLGQDQHLDTVDV